MATPSLAPNPFTGSSWDASAPPPRMPPLSPLPAPAPGSGGNMNPGGFGNPTGSKEVQQNIGLSNLFTAAQKNTLAPQFAAYMSKFGGDAGQFFEQLKNLGSPYYKQKQTEALTQGVQQNKNARSNATQAIDAEGYGHTPSGANAATIGGMEQSGAQSLAEQYLQNLFQNEQMQLAGAQGEAGLAQLFNPTQLLTTTGTGMSQSTTSPSFFQDLQSTLQAIGSGFRTGGPGG